MGSDPAIRLSVVVACLDARGTIDRCLDSLRVASEGVRTEALIVHPDSRALAESVQRRHQWVRCVSARKVSLVPELWSTGFRVSRGAVVAFTTGHFVVPTTWVQTLLAAVEAGAVGAGGSVDLADGSSILDRAIYFLRYSSFMPPAPSGPVAEIPGDNAAYARGALERHAGRFARGFWEVDVHRRVRAEGGRLEFAAGATATIGKSYSFRTIFWHRFLHGRHFGEHRVSVGGTPRWRGILAAPVVPLVLTLRILRRLSGRRRALFAAITSLPAMLPLAAAWAAGEACGALRAAGRRPSPGMMA